MYPIIRRQEMANGEIILNEIDAPVIAEKARPGQFVILKAGEAGERIPLTISDADPGKGTITVIYQVVGTSTARFKQLQEGDEYTDVIGPLGKPTEITRSGTVLCVGGGTGVAVLFPIVRGFKQAGNHIVSVMGARTEKYLILEEKMRSVSDELHICTDDGSAGHHGFVTDVVRTILEGTTVHQAVAIGPVPMMKLVCEITRSYAVKTLVSLNPIMVDGTGMCGGCRVSVNGENRFACVDGPEFDGHSVDFDGLMKRLQAYRHYEEESSRHACKCNRDLNN